MWKSAVVDVPRDSGDRGPGLRVSAGQFPSRAVALTGGSHSLARWRRVASRWQHPVITSRIRGDIFHRVGLIQSLTGDPSAPILCG